MDWTIREAGVRDSELILPLLLQVHDLHVAALPRIYRADTPAGEFLALLRDLLGRDGFTGLIAVAPDGSALGYVLYEIEARERTPVKEAQELGLLHHASVDRDRRRAGIGLALIEAMKARLRAAGVARLRTTYASFNEPSAALMRKAGLAPVHVTAEGPL